MQKFSSAISTVIVLFVATMVSAGLPAFAQEINPCARDFKEVCSDITPGGGRWMRCYEERKDKMSPSCRSWVEQFKSSALSVKEVCAKELDSWCNFEKGDPYAMLECLRSNFTSLSQACREKFNWFKDRYPKPNPDRTQFE